MAVLFCGSMVIHPRLAPVLASACPRTWCPPWVRVDVRARAGVRVRVSVRVRVTKLVYQIGFTTPFYVSRARKYFSSKQQQQAAASSRASSN